MRAVITIALLALPAAAEWTRVRSPQIEVLTDAGEKTGRQVLERFDEIRRIFRQANAPASPIALRVFVFAAEREFRAYREDAATDGFYQSAPERDYIALYAAADAGRVVVHEYVHLVLSHASAPLPKWFEEGTAEFYSTIAVDGARMSVGQPIESHIATLAKARLLTASELARVTHASPFYNERALAGMFYAQSWALVHMLNLSSAYRGGMPDFALFLSEGRAPEQAFQQAFGKTLDQALADLPGYLRNVRGGTVAAPPAASRDNAAERPVVERIGALEATLARADLALHAERRALARTLFEQAAREHPDSPGAAAGLGALALAEDRKAEARRYLERAIALDTRNAEVYFELASLEPQRADEWLERTIALNPNFAEAHFLLGVRATDAREYQAAIRHLREAVRILPRQSYFWHALAFAQMKVGMRQEAAESARKALASATTEEHERMAEALLRQTGDPPAAVAAKRPEITTPSTWQNPKGDARVEGVLTRVDCLGSSAKLHVAAGGKEVILDVRNPGEVELVNAPEASYQFSCGQQSVRVAVEYQADPDQVTRIEFRP